MEKKRTAAAEVFANQYVQQQAVQEELDDSLLAKEIQTGSTKKAKRRSHASSGTLQPGAAPPPQAPLPPSRPKTSEELQLEKEPIRVRETGFLLWKRVIIPPNAYVVHTRTGRTTPVTLGLGVSFRYNPYSDAYLVVPSAMQTIGVVANCITKEKQGINVLAYVQWQIDDFSVAYRKLDFSDSHDPLGIVNAQLSEQAEAAIKDKISTMSVEEVLTDKAPVIEELTTRLKLVAEGRKQNEQTAAEGLGIKIITVQIREALVSSQRLWQDLQAPFRHEQRQTARSSELNMESEIRKRELETRQADETREAETMVEIERIKQSKETEAADLRTSEELVRFQKEQEASRDKTQLNEKTTLVEQESQQRVRQRIAEIEQQRELHTLRSEQEKLLEQAGLDAEAHKRQKSLQIEEYAHGVEEDNRLNEIKIQAAQQQLERETELHTREGEATAALQKQKDAFQMQMKEADLARQRKEREQALALEEKTRKLALLLQEKEADILRLYQETRNLTNEHALMGRLIEKLPELAAEMPEIHELKVLQTDKSHAGIDSFVTFLAKILATAESLGIQWKPEEQVSPTASSDQARGE